MYKFTLFIKVIKPSVKETDDIYVNTFSKSKNITSHHMENSSSFWTANGTSVPRIILVNPPPPPSPFSSGC